MAKRSEDTPPAGSPAWMATFSDLMNLLLCFFVMLFAMSSVNEEKLQEFVAAMNNNTFSIFNGGASAIGDGFLISNGVSQLNQLDQYINSTGKVADSSTEGESFEEFDKSPEALEQMVEDNRLQESEERAEEIEEALGENDIGDEVEVSFTAQYVRLRMSGALLFASGRAELTDGAEKILDKLGLILERYPGAEIEIQGHTDNVPMTSGKFADNEELSSARALSVFYYLEENTLLNPVNIKHAGMGERIPIADNSTPEGRSRNRRVEILIYNPSAR